MDECSDVRELKQELLALMLAMHMRIQSLECLQEQQNSAIQACAPVLYSGGSQEVIEKCECLLLRSPVLIVFMSQDLMRGLAASTGQEGGPEIDKQPFISGTFEYGVGRPAAKRKVCLNADNFAATICTCLHATPQIIKSYPSHTAVRLCRCIYSPTRVRTSGR